MAYYGQYSNLSRRPSFHGTAHSDYQHGAYDDGYPAPQSYGEVNNRPPAHVPHKPRGSDEYMSRQPYQQFPSHSQTAFPGYNPPPLNHQPPFGVPREHQSSDPLPSRGGPHDPLPHAEPIRAMPSIPRRNSVNDPRRSRNAHPDPRAHHRDSRDARYFSDMATDESPPESPLLTPPNHMSLPANMRPIPPTTDLRPPPAPPPTSYTKSRPGSEYPAMRPIAEHQLRPPSGPPHSGFPPPGYPSSGLPPPGPPPLRRMKSRTDPDYPYVPDGMPSADLGPDPLGAYDSDRAPSFRPAPAYANSYEDSPLTEPAYFEGAERGRTLSTGYHNASLVAPPLGSYPSKHYRSRRASTPGPYSAAAVTMNAMNTMNTMGAMDTSYMQRTGASIVFKLKGEYAEGISLSDAMADARLSRSYQYAFHQLHLGLRGRMMARVRWNGYRPLNYEIPVTGYDGIVNMQSLARRLARAIVHFLQTNGITIPWDRVILHRLEEETHGLWLPILTTI